MGFARGTERLLGIQALQDLVFGFGTHGRVRVHENLGFRGLGFRGLGFRAGGEPQKVGT